MTEITNLVDLRMPCNTDDRLSRSKVDGFHHVQAIPSQERQAASAHSRLCSSCCSACDDKLFIRTEYGVCLWVQRHDFWRSPDGFLERADIPYYVKRRGNQLQNLVNTAGYVRFVYSSVPLDTTVWPSTENTTDPTSLPFSCAFSAV